MPGLDFDPTPIEAITDTAVRLALVNWRRGKLAPTPLLRLHLLGDMDISFHYARDVMLFDAIVKLVQARLSALRDSDGVDVLDVHNDSRSDALDQLQLDFTQASQETVTSLMAYSALYFRYITLVEISVTDLAQTAGVTPRHFRRSVQTGVSLLAQELRRLEFKAHHPPPG